MMGPTRLDSVSSEECRKVLRRMELEAYGSVVSTLRAQGELNKDRKKLLEDLSVLMKISPERHKAEIRRAVNDEKLGCIANRLSGGVDTEWSWALEGRRVVPLMPRLVYPTPFTALATNVSKIVNQNPRICLNQTPVISADEPGASRYVRDPDDEDTLSPVMVPIASPDSSCHSNNNFESDFSDFPHHDKNFFSHGHEIEKKIEPSVVKKLVPYSTNNANPIKRPRSPSSQVVNVSAPMSKVRAVSPNCVRPIQKVVNSTPLPYQPSPRGQVLNSIRPTMQQHQQHMTSPISVPGKIRIRAPVVQAIGRTAPTNMRPTIPQNFTQTPTGIPRTVTNNNAPPIKQVVQIRTTSQQQFQLQQQQHKQQISSHTNQANANAVRTVPTVNSVASTIAKTLPGKANVIVLHKNSPMAQTITTAARENERCSVVNKTNFLPKTVSTPTGTKMTFPSNVRIISVPSGSVAGSPGVVGNHASLAQKIMSSSVSGSGATAQKNVYVLELTNDTVNKSVIMGEVVPASLVSELNGVAPKTVAPTPSVKEGIEASRENETKTEILNTGETAVNGVKNSESDAIHRNYGCSVLPSADSSAAENNVQHDVAQVEIPSAKQEDSDLVVKLEPGTLELHVAEITPSYSSSTALDERGNEQESATDIFTSAIASAGINMEATSPFNNEDNTAGTRLILTDVYDSPSAKS